MITGPLHWAFPISDASRIGEARRHAALLASDLGWDEVQAGKLALVVTELGSNLLRHAQQGKLLIALLPEQGQIEVLSLDRGPGMAHPERSLDDGYSTSSTPGTGLGAVRRLAHSFDMHSSMPEGTLIVARVGAPRQVQPAQRVQLAGLRVAAPGETACGDAWGAWLDGDSTAILVADGLGHGPQAQEAAQAATALFHAAPAQDAVHLLQDAHSQLRSTRGAAVCHLVADSALGIVTTVGAGNIRARVVSGIYDKSIATQNGTLGVQMRRPESAQTAWPAHALVVMHSDGLESRWSPSALLPVLGRDPVLAAALLYRDHCRGRDDATIVVMRRGGDA